MGLSSEAFNRLWTVRILEDFDLPPLLGSHQPVIWFALFTLIGSGVSWPLHSWSIGSHRGR